MSTTGQDDSNNAATEIQKYYQNAHILVTGATGFVGCLLIEKLLFACHDLDTLYLIIRDKKGKNLEERLDELFADVVFQRLYSARPAFRAKVRGISGDCAEPSLGLSESDAELLRTNVTLVFHGAASVRFQEPLRAAGATNVRAAHDLYTLCARMPRLRHVVHVSTAYAHCPRRHLDECLYEPPIAPARLCALTEALDDAAMDRLTPGLLGRFPNTYTYTKACAEDIVRQFADRIPLTIVRPAIITSTYTEPLPGWINNLYGPVGVTAAAMAGLLNSLHCDSVVNANIIPADMVVNAIIVTPWHAEMCSVQTKQTAGAVRIYNYVSTSDRPITWGEFQDLTYRYGIAYPTARAIRYYSLTLRKNRCWHSCCVLVQHTVPAYIVDGVLRLLGKKPMLVKAYDKLHKFSAVISYFAVENWTYDTSNVRALCDAMSERDQALFRCDLRTLDWSDYFRHYPLGVRQYLLNDPIESLPAAKRKFQRLYWLHLFTNGIYLIIICGALYAIFRVLRC